MPVKPTYPGVYIEEVPSGVRTITGVATSITAFVGRALRGPINEPVTVNSYGDFERVFGGLWAESSLGFAVRDFFLNGGSQGIVVREFRPVRPPAEEDAAKSAADAVGTAAVAAEAVTPFPTAGSVAAAASDEAATHTADPDSVRDAAQAVAAAGEIEAARVTMPLPTADTVCNVLSAKAAAYVVASPERVAADTVVTAATDSAVTARQASATAVSQSATVAAGVFTAEPAKTAATAVANAIASAAFDLTATKETVLAATREAVAAAAPITRARLDANGLNLIAASPGSWGGSLRARIDYYTKDSGFFNLWVRDGGTGIVELFRNLSVESTHPRRVDSVLENESVLVRVRGGLPTLLPGNHADPAAGADVWAAITPSTSTGVTADGMSSDGSPLTAEDITGSQADKTGLYALEKADLFNVLCIPPHVAKDVADPASVTAGNVDPGVVTAAATYCEMRRAFLIVDSLAGWSDKTGPQSPALAADIGTSSKNAALFFSRLNMRNPLHENQVEAFAACGAVAGVFARTDAQRGVWKAPAGLDAVINGTLGPTVPLTDAENGELNPLGVNCLRTMPAVGTVVWGARTLQGDDRLASEWKYIPVRRTALFLEESLYRGTQWVVFEPNDERLWAQIRMNIGSFMHGLFRQGAFQGMTPKEAYFVKCDRETTTQDDINQGIVNILVGFAPLKPAEFVMIKLQQMAGQIQV